MMANLWQRLRATASPGKTLIEKAAVNATTLPPELLETSSGGGGWFSLFSGFVAESFAGAWQRNIGAANTPSILAFSAVYACVSIISGDIAKLPLRIMRALPKGGREPHPKHPLDAVLWTPNHYQTRIDFIQQVMVSTLLAGNAYIYLERDARGVVAAMYCLDPRRVTVLVADSGDVFYQVARDKLAGMGADSGIITFPASEIIHHRLMCTEHPLVGVTPLYSAGTSASVGARILMNSGAFFGNQSRPSGILSAPGRIAVETAKALKEQWEQNFSKGNVGRVAVMGDGLKWEPLVMSAIDAQLIDQLRWSVEDVARAFRVPVFLLGDLSKVTYRNSEQMARHYYSGCLQYHIEALEARFDNAFRLSSEVFIEFDLDPLLRTEMDVRFEAHKTAIQSGFKTINEVRATEGDAPLKGGDEPLVQIQYVPLSQLGKAATKAPGSPSAAGGINAGTAGEDDGVVGSTGEADGAQEPAEPTVEEALRAEDFALALISRLMKDSSDAAPG